MNFEQRTKSDLQRFIADTMVEAAVRRLDPSERLVVGLAMFATVYFWIFGIAAAADGRSQIGFAYFLFGQSCVLTAALLDNRFRLNSLRRCAKR